jgi:hypothetical protein
MLRIITVLFIFLIASSTYAQFRSAKIPGDWNERAEIFPIKADQHLFLNHQKPVTVATSFDDEIVGNTIYDLQTFNSIQQRIFTHPDGTIGLTWMMGYQTGSWSDRGTGYNYFDGTVWNDYPMNIIEDESTGWPCYAPLGESGEIVVSFYYADNEWYLVFNKREIKGEGDWESFYLFGPEGYGLSNPALITNGPENGVIHLLANSRGQDFFGQSRTLFYYRSMDGGETWDIEHYYFEELGSEYFSYIPGDSYSWAAPNGDTLAFSVGFLAEHGFIMKSYNNGDSWEKVLVYENPFAPYQGGATPVFGAGDITQSVSLDSQGKAHMVFGRMKYYYNAQGIQYYFPATEGLIYWNESMEPLDTTIVSSYTLEYLIESGNLVGWVIPNMGDSTLLGWGEYYVSLTSFPQINIDELDRIYVLYSGVAAGYELGSKNFRHIYGNSSNDGGLTWNGITDCNVDLIYLFAENVFPAMSPTFYNNKIHLFFQSDIAPGLHVWTNEHDPVNNDIIYMSLDTYQLTGLDSHQNDSESTLQLHCFPNPCNDKANITFKLETNSRVILKIYSNQGNLVRIEDVGRKEEGTHQFLINRNDLPAGIYCLSIETDDQIHSSKIIFQ